MRIALDLRLFPQRSTQIDLIRFLTSITKMLEVSKELDFPSLGAGRVPNPINIFDLKFAHAFCFLEPNGTLPNANASTRRSGRQANARALDSPTDLGSAPPSGEHGTDDIITHPLALAVFFIEDIVDHIIFSALRRMPPGMVSAALEDLA